MQQLKIGSNGCTPSDQPKQIWLNPCSKYCFGCGTQLCECCSQRNEPITSIKFRFCPFCGNAY